jgi:hypothetical protein
MRTTHRQLRRWSRRAWPPRSRAAAVVIATAGLVLLVVACSGGPSPTGSSGSSDAAGSTGSQQLAFAQCMRTHGVPDFPDPDTSGAFNKVTLNQLATGDPRFQTAQNSCLHLIPNAGSVPNQAQAQQSAAQALSFSQCVRTHGVTNFPDPDRSGRIPDPASVGIDQGSPQFQAANQACGRYRPPYMPSNAAYNSWARTSGS